MIAALKGLNLALRFGLEVALLGAVAVFCWRTLPHGAVRMATTVGAPIVVMTIWATVVHGANVPPLAQLATQAGLFAAAVAAVAALDHPQLATAFAGAVTANAALMWAWGQ
ncbi:MAG TPA: DUF2568 domain-containing protein [Acidimicrobiales bacterium]|nr:DUF2568 domain-containing protein [Acidimicrobiales bacterium]